MMTDKQIFDFFKAQGFTDAGAAGLMGNLYAESGLRSNNLQNSYEGKLGMADAEYTELVDKGSYKNFGNDMAGYGLAQWTYPTRKAALLAYAKAAGKSIGDPEMQLNFLVQELAGSYKTVLAALKTAASVRAASDAVLLQFEFPADQSEAVKLKRAGYSQNYFDKYAKKGVTGITENQLRQKVADVISGWTGASKGTAKHLEILSIYNNYKPLARGYKVQVNDAYCAATVSAAYIKAGIAPYIGTECGVGKYIDLARSKSLWEENDAHVPQVGDACVYDWDDTGVGDCTGAGDHIGIVTSVSSGSFTVTEGNMNGGKVGTRTMKVNGKYIRGFICPNYAAITKALSSSPNTSSAPATPPSAAVKEKKATESARTFDKTLAGAYTVNAPGGLHIRNGASAAKTSLAVLPYGTKVQNYGYFTLAGGVKWLYVQAICQGVKYTGFTSAQYLKKA